MKIRYLGFVLLGLFMILLLAVGMVLMNQYTQPLGPSLTLSSAEGAGIPGSRIAPSPTPLQPKAAEKSPNKPLFCGNKGKMTVMVVGSDYDPSLYPPGADLVRYLQVDFDQQKVTIFTFPRGLWLDTKHLAEVKIDAARLGKVYAAQYQADFQKNPKQDEQKLIVKASQTVAQTIFDNFDLKPDHYVVIKLSHLPGMIDTVGGVTIDNPTRLSFAIDNRDVVFETGPLTLDGLMASYYVRYEPFVTTDWDRTDRQNLVLNALKKKLVDPATLPKIPSLLSQVAGAIVTDLSAENVTDLTCVLQNVPEDQTILENVHPDMVTPGPDQSIVPDVAKVKDLLNSLGMLP